MLQNIRDKMQSHKWLTYLVLGALALVFAVWGTYSAVDAGFSSTDYAAKVNGEKISTAAIDELWRQQQPRFMQLFGGNVSDAQQRQFKQELLDEQVRRLATTQYAHKTGFRVSRETLSKAFRSEPSFQVEGQFNVQEAKARLASVGMSEEAYIDDLRTSLLVNQMLGSVGVSDFLTPAEAKRLFSLLDEEREIRYALVQPDSFAGTAAVSDADIEAHYKAHAAQYMQPEWVQLAYAELSLADTLAKVQVTEDQLKQRYERDKATYVQPETRRASHILIAVDSTTDDAKAAAQAKDLYNRIKSGGDFAALAKQFSKDTGSAEKGGDLDWAGKDVYAKEFGDKLFAMKQGEVSEPVKTQYGYHIIRLDGVRASAGRSFDEVRDELTAQLRNELAANQFGSQQDQIQERLDRGGVTLDKLVQEFGLHKGEVARFERGAGGLPLGSDADLNKEVFSEAVLAQGRIGGPIQLGEDRVTVFQVVKHQPAAQRSLAEVRADIVSTLRRQHGEKEALAATEAAVGKLGAGEAFDKVAAGLRSKAQPARYVGRTTPDIPVQVRDAIFAAPRPVAGKPLRQAVKVDGGAVALIEVTGSRVQPLSEDHQVMQMRYDREVQRYARRNADSYVAEILKSAKVRQNPAAFQ